MSHRIYSSRHTHDPWGLWLALVLFAVAGSCAFGASFAVVLPGWNLARTAVWFALSAGLAWCLFIPTLHLWFGLSWSRAVHAALMTMAGGEVVLCTGALVNFVLAAFDLTSHAGLLNAGVVGLSNVAMCGLLAAQLRRDGISPRHTVTAWMLVLNGSGALFFALLFRLVHVP